MCYKGVKEWFYTITESMLNLGLMGTELNLFAVIFGYSQKGDGCCYAKREELARRCGVKSKRTIDTAMAGLIEKGLVRRFTIIKDGKSVTAYSYTGSAKIAPVEGANSAPVPVQNLKGRGANSAPMENKRETQTENTIPPTPQAVADYCRNRGFKDPEGFADMFIEICNNAGWRRAGGKGEPITNWKNYIVSSWESNHKNKTYPRAAATAQSVTKTTLDSYLR